MDIVQSYYQYKIIKILEYHIIQVVHITLKYKQHQMTIYIFIIII